MRLIEQFRRRSWSNRQHWNGRLPEHLLGVRTEQNFLYARHFLDESVNCGPQRTFFDRDFVRHVDKATRGHELAHAILGFLTVFRLSCNSEICGDHRVSV
jgi:hypothetical protein